MRVSMLGILTAGAVVFVSCNENSSSSSSSTEVKDTTQVHSTNEAAAPPASPATVDYMSTMNAMMQRMQAQKMTGDFDVDFATMMIEHHRGAIEMSQQELSAGKDGAMKAMAQKIIDAQQAEISELQKFVNSYKPSGMKHGEGELSKSMSTMMEKMHGEKMSGDVDKDFAMMMVSHHQSAVDMAKLELKNGMSADLKKMAQKTVDDQTREIEQFNNWLKSHK